MRPSAYVSTLALAALGCATEVDPYTADADTGTTHALVSIERDARMDGHPAPSAVAFARFVAVPAYSDSAAALDLVGVSLALPPLGECQTLRARDPSTPLSSLGPIELLEVGNVVIEAGGFATTLAPHAFPTVTDVVSGVVYTTRDRSADPLPEGAEYVVRTTGTETLPPMGVRAVAPAMPEGVHTRGLPLDELVEASAGEPLNVTWRPGAGGDLVYVLLSTSDGAATMACSFAAELGSGTVPAGAFDGRGPGTVSVHVLRATEFEATGLDRGELRFDFEVAAPVTFVD